MRESLFEEVKLFSFFIVGLFLVASFFGFLTASWWFPFFPPPTPVEEAIIPLPTEENAPSLSYTVKFEKPKLTEVVIEGRTFTSINLPECTSSAEPGNPALPFCTSRILLPFGGELVDIDISHGNPVELELDSSKPVMPQQDDVRLCGNPNIEFRMNNSAYVSSSPACGAPFEDGGVGIAHGFEILAVHLRPVNYIPKEGRLYYYPEMTITVKLKGEKFATLGEKRSKKNRFLRYTDKDLEMITSMVVNPVIKETYSPTALASLEDSMSFEGESQSFESQALLDEPLDEYPGGLCDPLENYEYVIITSEELNDTNGTYNWTDLINHRQSYSGLTGAIVTVEEIGAESAYWNGTALFNDTQAHMREFCKDAYQDWGAEYIILGGDWDSTASHQQVPYRLFEDRYETASYDTMACDMYYSHLDGDWWYPDSGGMWGGGRNSGVNDKYGELYVGRIAAYDADMVSNAISKIIWYDTNGSITDDWLNFSSFWGGDLGWSITSKAYMEELRLGTDTYRTFEGFEEWNTDHPAYTINTSERLYHADIGASYKTYWDAAVESDNMSMINHLSHSGWNTPFSLTNWQFRYNTKPFFGYSQGCMAGRFHSGFAGCEQMICRHSERHAYALVLNTGYGYGSTSTTNGASQYINAYFWDYLFNETGGDMTNWQLGKAFVYAKDKMGSIMNSKTHSWAYAWYSAHFFGDPAQKIRIKNAPGTNNPIVLSNEQPYDGKTGVSTAISSLNVTMFDPNGDTFDYTITTSPNIGSCSVNGASNGAKSCPVSSLNASTTYTWKVNVTDGEFWTNETYSFTTDDGVNDPPVVSGINDQTIPEGGSFSTISLDDYVNDPDNNDDDMTWFYSGNSELSVSIVARVATISTPHNDWYGSETITFNATDPGGLSDVDSAVYTVNSVNDPPVVSSIPGESVPEGGSFSIIDLDDYVNDIDHSDNEMTWTYSGNSELSVSIVARVATISTPSPNWIGSEVITFRATDPQGGWDEDDATFTVIGENDPPVVSDIPNQAIPEGTSFSTISLDDYVEDPDNLDSEISWTYSGNSELSVSIVARVATISTPSPNWTGSETITFRATDPGSLYDEDSAIFTVNPQGAPVISNPIPVDETTGVPVSLSTLSATLEDDGNSFDWNIVTGPDVGSCSGSGESNGTKSCSVSTLAYSTTYLWNVSVTDGITWTNETFAFTAEDEPGLVPAVSLVSPSNGGSTTDTTPDFSYRVSDADNAMVSCTLYVGGSSKGTKANSVADGSTTNTITSSTLSVATHNWFVRCDDGNSTGDSSMWSIRVYKTSSGGGRRSSGGGGESPPPKPAYNVSYSLSSITEDEIKDTIETKSIVRKALLGAGFDVEDPAVVSRLAEISRFVYGLCNVSTGVTHPDSLSTQIDVRLICSNGIDVKDLMVFVEVPKTFAQSSDGIIVTTEPPAKVVVVENDPVYSFTHKELTMSSALYTLRTAEYLNRDAIMIEWKQPWFFFGELIDKDAPILCGDGVKGEGEECDGTDGIPQGYVCTLDCTLEKLPVQCVDDGVCTSGEREIGNCVDCAPKECFDDGICTAGEIELGMCDDCLSIPSISQEVAILEPIKIWAGSVLLLADLVMIIASLKLWKKDKRKPRRAKKFLKKIKRKR